MVKGIIGSLIGGAIGAALWATVCYVTNYEIGWIAVLVGVACGFGMSLGSSGEGGVIGGLIACGIAIIAIVVGKYACLHYALSSAVSQTIQNSAWTDAMSKSCLADQLVVEYEEAGKPLKWPEGVDPAEAIDPEDYPPDLWKDVELRWASMSVADQAAYTAGVKAFAEQQAQIAAGNAAFAGFSEMFTPFDVLWFVFAVVGAYKFGGDSND